MNRLRSRILVFASTLLLACGAQPPGENAPPCPAYSHSGADGGCESTLRWSAGPDLPLGMHHHVTFAVASDAGTHLYVAGGANSSTNFIYGVGRSLVGPDGTLGEWKAATSLPRSLVGHSVAAVGSTVVVTGGMLSSHQLSNATYVSVVQPDGELGPWQTGPDLPASRMHHTTVSAGDFVFLVGGQTADGPLDTVHRARVTAPGTLDAWVEVTKLPEPRSEHSVAVSGRFLLLTGGLTSGENLEQRERDVLRAEIQDDGALGAWALVSELPVRLSVHASFVHNGWLYVAGGVKDGSGPTSELFRARILADGVVGAWDSAADALPFARAHVHQMPVLDEHFVYSVGGMVSDSGESSPRVSIAQFQ